MLLRGLVTLSTLLALPLPAAAQVVSVADLPRAWARAIFEQRVSVEVHGLGEWSSHGGDDTAQRVVTLEASRGSDDPALATGIVIDATHCRATLRALRDLAPVRRVGGGPLRVNVAFGRIGTGERTLSSFDGRLCGSGNYPGDFVGVDLELLSLVGPILSVGTTAMEAGAGGPPYSDAHWETLDVRTGAVVAITEWIDAASLLEALTADPYLAEHHAEAAAAVGAADSYADAVEVLIPALGGALGAFAILDWSERDGTVGIRLALPVNNCGMCPAVLESLSLRVQPRPELLRHLRSAARGDGHFLSAGPISAL